MQHGTTVKIVKEGLTPNEIHSNFIKVYGDSSSSFSTINTLQTGDADLRF